ncbi:MAG TPA: hypothetical protein VIS06_04110 [Mycobacteriales bacterium]
MSQTPTIGRIVHYRLSAQDAAIIRDRRAATGAHGNPALEGDVYPAEIVRVFGPADNPDRAVNLQVGLDGEDTYWATSRTEGDGPGTWFWPPRV